jgi:hypothetical protein
MVGTGFALSSGMTKDQIGQLVSEDSYNAIYAAEGCMSGLATLSVVIRYAVTLAAWSVQDNEETGSDMHNTAGEVEAGAGSYTGDLDGALSWYRGVLENSADESAATEWTCQECRGEYAGAACECEDE